MSKTKECFAYNTKIIETPATKEVYIYETPIFINVINLKAEDIYSEMD